MKKLLVVDGSNLLFQMFYGMPARIAGKDGRAVHGTVGFVGALLKIIRMTAPTHICVLFDGEGDSERRKINPDYKANREDYSDKPEEEIPFSQLPDIYAALDFLGIRRYETHGCEADDLIAAYAKGVDDDTELVISSFDSDFFQLVSSNVSVLRYRGDSSILCTPEYVEARFGVPPSQYADFKSLVGDTADNIRGADKIGPKTAAELLCKFGDLEGIISSADNIKKPSVRASVLSYRDRLLSNRTIIRLSGEAELPYALCELEYRFGGQTTRRVLEAIGVF